MIIVERAIANKAEICRNILNDMAVAWPGLDRNKDAAIQALMELPMFAADLNGRVAGFVCLQQMAASSWAVVFVGVLRSHQRQGAGRALLRKAEEFCGNQKASFLTAKTVAESDHDRDFGGARQFFARVGFSALEVMPQIWGKDLPCLYMVKTIEQEREQGEYTWY
ncbi:GNAT family N-acetyltransferase [Bartonella sp. LJL80]